MEDSNGYGHSKGNGDGDGYIVEVWFDVYQNDNDDDGLMY